MEELRVAVADLAEWMANFYLPWDAYHAKITCGLVVLDKRLIVRLIGIG